MSPHLVLVHGAGHGAWCWYKIRCLLETSGYKVTCFDLIAAGIDQSDPNSVLTFEDYNKPLIDFFLNLPDNEKVILVGHSAGGLSLTYAIHRFGCKKIHVAIYVAANMLKHGFATDQDFKHGTPDLFEYENLSEASFRRNTPYNMSPVEDSTLASMLLRPTPTMAFRDAQFTDGPDSDKVPRVYIKTLCDQIIKPEEQDDFLRRWPPSQVFVLESDHSPFFSAPFVLMGFLVKVVTSIKI